MRARRIWSEMAEQGGIIAVSRKKDAPPHLPVNNL